MTRKYLIVTTNELLGGADIILYSLFNNMDDCFFIANIKLKQKNPILNKQQAIYFNFIALTKTTKSIFQFLISLLRFTFFVYRYLKNNEISHIIVNDFGALAYFFIIRIFTSHQIIFYSHAAFNDTKVNRYLLARFINFMADNIISPSFFLKKNHYTIGINSNKIIVIHNGVKEINEPNIAMKASTHHKYRIALIGNIVDLKGQDVFVDALNDILEQGYDIKGVLIGPISDVNYFNAIKYKHSKIFNNGSVEFLGWLSHADVLKYLSTNVDIVVCASKYLENLPTTLLEAMSMKKAVIGTSVGGIPEIIENGKNGILVTPGESVSLSNAIIEMISNPNFHYYGNNGYKIYSEKFNFQLFKSKILDFLYSLD